MTTTHVIHKLVEASRFGGDLGGLAAPHTSPFAAQPGLRSTRRLRECVRTGCILTVAAAFLTACSGDVPTSLSVDGRTSSVAALPSLALPADSVARGLALALRDGGIRQQLRDDLRDSPFPNHALPLRAYLRTPRGASVSAAISVALNMTAQAFQHMLDGAAPLSIVVERPLDRVRWEATDDIIVYGAGTDAVSRIPASGLVRGYVVDGEMRELSLRGSSRTPYMAVMPLKALVAGAVNSISFRSSASRLLTISSRSEEQALMMTTDSCENMDECNGGPTAGIETGGTLLPTGIDQPHCFGWTAYSGVEALTLSNDVDQDGIRDDCEYLLAYAFRPMLARNNSDRAPGREPYFSVAKSTVVGRGTVKIFYALSYYRDPGSPIGSFENHDGDSEFIIVYVHNTADQRGSVWALDVASLSAHWGAGTNIDHSGTYGVNELEFPVEYRGRPRVWVSKDKHANYPSKYKCDWVWNDYCDPSWDGTAYEDVEVLPSANLGNKFDTTPARYNGIRVNSVASRNPQSGLPGVESFWTDVNFTGWHGFVGQPVAGGYVNSLSFFQF